MRQVATPHRDSSWLAHEMSSPVMKVPASIKADHVAAMDTLEDFSEFSQKNTVRHSRTHQPRNAQGPQVMPIASKQALALFRKQPPGSSDGRPRRSQQDGTHEKRCARRSASHPRAPNALVRERACAPVCARRGCQVRVGERPSVPGARAPRGGGAKQGPRKHDE